MTDWLGKSDRIPSEAAELVTTWIGAQRSGRDLYSDAVTQSFDLARRYYQGVQDRG